jgi:hypothetical protein
MSSADLLSLGHKQMRLVFTTLCCVLAALMLLGCGPSKDAGPTANSPTPDSTNASPRVASTTNEYSIGDKINFAANGNSKPFKVSGWSEAESTHSWTDGAVSVLAMRISPATNPLTLTMKLAGFVRDPEFPSQPVEVYANDEKIADWNVRDRADYTAPIPPAISQSGGLLTITLKIPKAASPKSLGLSNDARLLGLACIEVSLTPTQ